MAWPRMSLCGLCFVVTCLCGKSWSSKVAGTEAERPSGQLLWVFRGTLWAGVVRVASGGGLDWAACRVRRAEGRDAGLGGSQLSSSVVRLAQGSQPPALPPPGTGCVEPAPAPETPHQPLGNHPGLSLLQLGWLAKPWPGGSRMVGTLDNPAVDNQELILRHARVTCKKVSRFFPMAEWAWVSSKRSFPRS